MVAERCKVLLESLSSRPTLQAECSDGPLVFCKAVWLQALLSSLWAALIDTYTSGFSFESGLQNLYCKEEKREFILEINRSEHGRGVQISVTADFMLQCGNSFVEFYINSEDSHKLRSFWCISGSVR